MKTKIYTRDNKPTEELCEVITKKHDNKTLTYEEVYYLDYEVNEDTGYIMKNKVKFYTKEQFVRNMKSLKIAIDKHKD